MARLGGYTRLSVYDGTSESPARQEEANQRFAGLRGDEIVKSYSDLDISGWDGSPRPGFEELLADAEAGVVDGIIVWKIDRLTRNFDDLQLIWKLVQQRGLKLVSVIDNVDTSTPMGIFGLRMMTAAAELESLNNSVRTKAGKKGAAENGRPHTGRRPFGYDYIKAKRNQAGNVIEPGRLEVNQREAAAAREAVNRLLSGESLASVTADVNRKGVRTPTGRKWQTSTLADALAAPALAGLRVHRNDVYKGQWEPIVTVDEHERLVALRKDPSRAWVRRGQPRKHLLAGLLYCGRDGCGVKLHTKPVRGVPRYKCPPEPYGRGCGRLSISAPHVEAVVIERVWEALNSEELGQALAANDQVAAGLGRQLQADEDQLKWLGRELGSDPLKRPAFLEAIAEVEGRIRSTRARIARQHKHAVLAALPAGVDQVKQLWEHEWDLDRRRALLDELIVKVTITPAKLGSKQGRAFDRSRVTVTWRV